MLVKNIIDSDTFIEKINPESQDRYFSLLYSLIDKPTTQNMDIILSSYSITDLVNSLKHLIKFKFNCLTENIQKNIIECVEIILQYSDSVDTLIINCLRVGLIVEINIIYKRKEKFFEKSKMALHFLAFHTQDKNLVEKLGVVTRDFYFKRVLKQLISPEPFTQLELDLLSHPTQMAFISSSVSVDLEMNLIFISNVKTNFNFYKQIILDDFILSEEIACKTLRFCIYIPFTDNIFRLSEHIVDKYPQSSLALIYDILFYNGKETVSPMALKWLERFRNNTMKGNYKFENLQKHFPNLEIFIQTISKGRSVEDIGKKIYNLNFQRYFEIITEMKDKMVPFIEQNLYYEIISISQDWDNYMQVYLWKILCFQKILFGFDLPEIELNTVESKEGAFLLSNLSYDS